MTDQAEDIDTSLRAFLKWLDVHGTSSHDSYDLWSTHYGKLAKRLYYRNAFAGAPLVLPVFGLDLLAPKIARLFIAKRRYPIADAQLILGYLNLYRVVRDEQYLNQAGILADELVKSSIPGYSGLCWGYPFDWESVIGAVPAGTPLITNTPYAYEAFCGLYAVTQEQKHLDIIRSIAIFAANDLHDTVVSSETAAASYTPHDRSMVINASAYRAALLMDAFERFGDGEWKEKAVHNVNFVLQSQRQDGSWFYEPGRSHNEFIDNIHTCFVLKNLHKANKHLQGEDIREAVQRGYSFYREFLFKANGMPKPFAYVKRVELVKTECYDLAEGISLGIQLRDEIPGAFDFATHLAGIVCRDFQMSDGHFVTKVLIGGLRNIVPYLRWPQAPMFLALTSLYKALHGAEPNHR